jgi:cation diffusion facilitator CzcD-associated flavoprotein CzcO
MDVAPAKGNAVSPIEKNGAVVILGAGPAGLACAYRLLASGTPRKVIVLDRAKMPGGGSASFKWKRSSEKRRRSRGVRQ